jgi:hypothetical protein
MSGGKTVVIKLVGGSFDGQTGIVNQYAERYLIPRKSEFPRDFPSYCPISDRLDTCAIEEYAWNGRFDENGIRIFEFVGE